MAIYKGLKGWLGKETFSKAEDTIRHITATIAHVQLSLGYILYFQSPMITYFREHYHEAVQQFNILFFGLIHIALMTLSVIIITIGSSLAKRQDTDAKKFRTMAVFFGVALVVIFIAIPWPFSLLSQRPYWRGMPG